MSNIFRLKNRSSAILSENNRRSVVPIPASAMVVLVGGDIQQDIFVKIRYEGKVLHMLSKELRGCGEHWDRSLSTEKVTNRSLIKVSQEVLDWLKEEQYQRWKGTGREPTRDELIRELIEIARRPGKLLKFQSSEAHDPRQSEETRNYIQMLISVLESGRKDAITAVQHHLQIFNKYVGCDPQHAKPLGKSHLTPEWNDLEDLKQIREHIQHLTRIYLRQQADVLESAQQKSKLHTAALIVSFLKSGAALRWGPRGWEIPDAGMLLPSETVEQLYELGVIGADPALEHDEERPFINDLLSDQGIDRLDRISRRAFRANQNRAYFEYLGELFALYQEHSMLHEGAISYPALVRQKIQFAYHFARLYLAGILHLLGMTETLRMRIAQCSIDAIGSLTA